MPGSEVMDQGRNAPGHSDQDGRGVCGGPPPGWYRQFVCDADAFVLEHSGKLVLLMEILHFAEQLRDKVLVFSQSLVSLDLIETFLELANKEKREGKTSLYKGTMSWVRDKDYYRLDGSTSATARKKWAQEFNSYKNPRGRLFLISTRAGSLGINLVGANRVVVFDASWNPTYDVQSIFRVYRFGQRKTVYVYRFLAQGTMEQKIYERQVAKQSLSSRVVDQQQIQRHFTQSQLSKLYRFQPDLEPRIHTSLPTDKVLALLLQQCGRNIVRFHEHDSLLDHREEEELSVEERKAAWEEYRAEETASVQGTSEMATSASLWRKTNKDLEASVQGTSEMVNSASLWKKTNKDLEALLKKGRIELQTALQGIESGAWRQNLSVDFFLQETRRRNPSLDKDKMNHLAVQSKVQYDSERKQRIEEYQQKLQEQQKLILHIQQILTTRASHTSSNMYSSNSRAPPTTSGGVSFSAPPRILKDPYVFGQSVSGLSAGESSSAPQRRTLSRSSSRLPQAYSKQDDVVIELV